jgi:hypothetical protein
MRPVHWVLTGVLLLGCAGPDGRAPPHADTDMPNEDLASSLEVGITADGVRMTFHVTNTSRERIGFTFPTAQRYDFLVEAEGGDRIWQWSADRAFLQVLTEAVLEPDETWTMSAEWDPEARTGTYVGVARLVAGNRQVERRTEFELP